MGAFPAFHAGNRAFRGSAIAPASSPRLRRGCGGRADPSGLTRPSNPLRWTVELTLFKFSGCPLPGFSFIQTLCLSHD
jgi:hypothetical protein